MTAQITTRTCPDCRTVFRDRGQNRCPHCGHSFGPPEPASSAESRAVPQPPPAPVAAENPAPPHVPDLVEQAPISATSELDALLLPYSPNLPTPSEPAAPLPGIETPPSPSPAEATLLEPQREPPPMPVQEQVEELHLLDPVEEALAGQHLVPADIRDKAHAAVNMPWYLKRGTLVGLALLAVLLVAVVMSLS